MTISSSCATVQEEMQKRREAVRPINERIARLREESVNADVKISDERAKLVTEFYKSGRHRENLCLCSVLWPLSI